MQYGVLPGGGSPNPQKKSPARVVVYLYNQVRRPSRFRGRLLLSVCGLMLISALIYGKKHVDLSRTASSLKYYIPDSITDAILQVGDFEEQRWDDEVNPENATLKKPKFHLLIPAKQPTENLCKTLFSAAILNYPPATLVSYGNTGKDTRPGADIVKNTFTFLNGKEVYDNDLILVVEEDTWFQLPAQVTINRFFHGLKDSKAKLLEKYGSVTHNASDGRTSNRQMKFDMKVLFGSSKECSNAPSDSACYSVPESPLPKDIYGDETDRHPEGKYNRPRYMSGSMVMGRVKDLRPIYKEASEILESDEIGKHGSQYIFSQIFGIQEYVRTLSLESSGNGLSGWHSWLSSVLSRPQTLSTRSPNITLKADKNYEFGIGLDYFSSIFQVMNNSAEDVRFVRFNHPSVISSPSGISAKAFKNPIHLPPDLALAPPPFFQNQNSVLNPDLPITELDNMHDDTALWTDIELFTNVIVPGSSVPALLNFDGSEHLLDGDMWEKMWFHPNARTLMRQYMRRPDGRIAASAAAEGGDKWWDLRGGNGGVWTDRGEWLEWNEVCGSFDEKVFGDDKGELIWEEEEVGGQKAVYRFGELVQGKPPKTKPANVDAHKTLIGDAMTPDTGSTQEDHPKGVPPSPPQETKPENAAKVTDMEEPPIPGPNPLQASPSTGRVDASQGLKPEAENHTNSEQPSSEQPSSEQPSSEKPNQASPERPSHDSAQQKQTEQEPHNKPYQDITTQSKETEQEKEIQNHLLSLAESKLASSSKQNTPVIEEAEGGQAMISELEMESSEAGVPMNAGGGTQVAGTMDLGKFKLASEKSFVSAGDGEGDGEGDEKVEEKVEEKEGEKGDGNETVKNGKEGSEEGNEIEEILTAPALDGEIGRGKEGNDGSGEQRKK